MNMNKKVLMFISIILLIFSSVIVVNAEPNYVGENLCAEESVQKILVLAGYILMITKVVVPLILMVIGSIDLYHAVIGGDKELGKSIKSLALRLVAGVFIFFIPSLVNFAFDLIYENSGGKSIDKQCVTCVLEPNSCK